MQKCIKIRLSENLMKWKEDPLNVNINCNNSVIDRSKSSRLLVKHDDKFSFFFVAITQVLERHSTG